MTAWVLILTAYIFMSPTPETHFIPLPTRDVCEHARVEIMADVPILTAIGLVGKCVERKP